jgi:uncharacterized membrane protein
MSSTAGVKMYASIISRVEEKVGHTTRRGWGLRAALATWLSKRGGYELSDLIGAVAALTASLFAGAALYINLVEHPARLACGTDVAARQWAPSYRRATVMQASLALTATVAGLLRWAVWGGAFWLWGAIVIAQVIPFTFLVVMDTNRKLLEPNRDNSSDETRRLLERWGQQHGVRTALSLAASLLYVCALVGS